MAKTNKEKNQLECNKRARKEYEKRNYKRTNIVFKNDEMEAVEKYCDDNNIPKNTLYREAIMQYIGKSID